MSKGFSQGKKQLCEKHILTHYDPKKQIVITCDASDDGISAILSHRINGEERPVFYASRTLTKAEKNYPILHREALAIVFAMEKFYKYIFGHFVEIFTDQRSKIQRSKNSNFTFFMDGTMERLKNSRIIMRRTKN
jgi:RNase H-like domain found in reverse transcriptase